MLAALCGGWSKAADQGFRLTRATETAPTLTVTALPLQAEVRVERCSVASAHDLVARALPWSLEIMSWRSGPPGTCPPS